MNALITLTIALSTLTVQTMLAQQPTQSSESSVNPAILGQNLTVESREKWKSIKKTQANLLRADRLLRSLAELESAEAEDWWLLMRKFAYFKDAVGNSPFNGLPAVSDLVTIWSLHISARGSNITQVVVASQAQARSVEALVQAKAGVSPSGKLEYKQRSNSDGSVTVSISGGTLGGALLAAREQAGSRLKREFWDQGFRKLISASSVVGKWSWLENTRFHGVIIFELRDAGKMYAEVPYSGVIKNGKGTWSLNDNKLTITGTHVGALGVYLKEQRETWITDREVLFFDEKLILLKGKDENRLDRVGPVSQETVSQEKK